jgi:transcriptional regulator of acetoin/glycerol metabolism
LEHSLEHAFILCRQPTITIDHLPPELQTFSVNGSSLSPNGNIDDPEIIREALEKSAWNKTKAAALLGISRRSIYRKIKDYNITSE